MYWWHEASRLAREGRLERFGLITTNSLPQTYSRQVVEAALAAKKPVSLVYAVPDHPWVDSEGSAAVRIAMTVGEAGDRSGVLLKIRSESPGDDEGARIEFDAKRGKLNAQLRAGPNVSGAQPLRSNYALCWQGCKLVGGHFQVDQEKCDVFAASSSRSTERLRRYWAGRDLTKTPRIRYVIDTYGLDIDQLRDRYPDLYQHLWNYIYPERSHNRDRTFREKWWLFGRPRPEMRAANEGLQRYIVTSEVSKHRFFVFLRWPEDLIDGGITSISMGDPHALGVVSSRVHVSWALAAGGRMGVGNDPRYQNGPCFDPFPFPASTPAQPQRIGDLAEQLDARRKHRQQLHPKLTLTGIYNVLEKLRSAEVLTEADKVIHEQGLVTVIGELHDEIDAAVLNAYNWSDLAPALVGKPGGTTPSSHKSPDQIAAEEELLERLVKLNAARAAEEEQGLIRWLRPEFQAPEKAAAVQQDLIPGGAADESIAAKSSQKPWPKTLPEQFKALKAALSEQPAPRAEDQIARTFKRAQTRKVGELLRTLVELGQARSLEDGRFTSV